ncbi:uncharacterized protein LOC109453648 [Rhinolophus sinicus]|uniref:uncharacterized protein LOC109453648 n=1 Tax=Rhinolophus sinicus TaxID=89399 RepID=UPI003D7A199A
MGLVSLGQRSWAAQSVWPRCVFIARFRAVSSTAREHLVGKFSATAVPSPGPTTAPAPKTRNLPDVWRVSHHWDRASCHHESPSPRGLVSRTLSSRPPAELPASWASVHNLFSARLRMLCGSRRLAHRAASRGSQIQGQQEPRVGAGPWALHML